MGVEVAKEAIDLGIVTTNGDAMLTFYRDVLGFKHEGDISMEHVGIKTMHRLWFGNSLIKIVVPVKDPGAPAAPGGDSGRHRVSLLDDDDHKFRRSSRCG